MTVTIGEIVSILFFLGAIVGVWVRAEVSIARLKERVLANEKQQNISDVFTTKSLEKFETMIKGQFEKLLEELKLMNKQMSELEIELARKADKI